MSKKLDLPPSKFDLGPVCFQRYMNGDDYRGSFSSGLPHGLGSLSNGELDSYEGSFSLGLPGGGEGKMTYRDGDVYDGSWEGGRPKGKGASKKII